MYLSWSLQKQQELSNMFFLFVIIFVLAQLPSEALHKYLSIGIADVIASGQLQVRQAAT